MGLLLDVTLISTKHTAVSGVLVIEKLLVADEVLLMVWVKCCKLLSSLFAVTSIFTPPEGMADVMVTDKSKGPSDGVCTDPLAGLVVTARLASVVPPPPPPPPPPLFLQPEERSTVLRKNMARSRRAVFMIRIINEVQDNQKKAYPKIFTCLLKLSSREIKVSVRSIPLIFCNWSCNTKRS